MTPRNLIPPLGIIENDLFGTTEQTECEHAGTRGDVRLATPEAPPASPVDTAMPAFLADAIERRHAANVVLSDRPWAAGQIRRLNAILDRDGNPRRSLVRPVALLLDRPGGGTHVRIAFDLARLALLAEENDTSDNEETA